MATTTSQEYLPLHCFQKLGKLYDVLKHWQQVSGETVMLKMLDAKQSRYAVQPKQVQIHGLNFEFSQVTVLDTGYNMTDPVLPVKIGSNHYDLLYKPGVGFVIDFDEITKLEMELNYMETTAAYGDEYVKLKLEKSQYASFFGMCPLFDKMQFAETVNVAARVPIRVTKEHFAASMMIVAKRSVTVKLDNQIFYVRCVSDKKKCVYLHGRYSQVIVYFNKSPVVFTRRTRISPLLDRIPGVKFVQTCNIDTNSMKIIKQQQGWCLQNLDIKICGYDRHVGSVDFVGKRYTNELNHYIRWKIGCASLVLPIVLMKQYSTMYLSKKQ